MDRNIRHASHTDSCQGDPGLKTTECITAKVDDPTSTWNGMGDDAQPFRRPACGLTDLNGEKIEAHKRTAYQN
jgi:hypothetical protein